MLVIGQPVKFTRLLHVDSLIWYDGEQLGHYTLDGENWLVSLLNFKSLPAHYQSKRLFYHVSDSDMKEFLANKMTFHETMKRSAEMWVEESTWEKLPNGHGVPDTHIDTWSKVTWQDIPDDERPSPDAYLNLEP